MAGKINLLKDDDEIPSILFREVKNVKHYISLKKTKSENSYKLTLTTVRKQLCNDSHTVSYSHLAYSLLKQHCLFLFIFHFRKGNMQQRFRSRP